LKQYACSANELDDMLLKFTAWLEKVGYDSYDPYDIWGTCYGQLARRLYYAKNPMGVALVGPIILMEIICPSLRSLFVKKGRFATADAQLVLGFLNLHRRIQGSGGRNTPEGQQMLKSGSCMKAPMALKVKGEPIANEEHLSILNDCLSTIWLTKAAQLAEELLGLSIPGYSGYCWGYPFDWQTVNGLIARHTPHITATPYCFEAFLSLFDVTGEVRYLEIARSIVDFVFKDIKDTSAGENAMAGSYTPYDSSKVVNASAYRAFVLFEAAHRFGWDAYADKAWRNLRFILQSQRGDGSWLYSIDDPKQAFIDHFHTCFVLKNLHKINLRLNNPLVRETIDNGYKFYRRELFDDNGLPKSFAIQPRIQINRVEMYNFAEAINLGVLLRNYIPEAFAMAHELAYLLLRRFQLRRGYFITRTYIGGLKHKMPFLRWSQAQLFHALTSLVVANASKPSCILTTGNSPICS